MNIIDYVSKNNLTMKDSPLNEVDSLVLSQLSYLYYEKVALPCKISDLTNYYNKSNTYSKTEIDGLISSAKSGRFVVADSLPTTNIKTDVIYLVPSSKSTVKNVKDEYINLDGTTSGWELIGSTAVDLSGDLKITDAESTYVQITDTESSNIDFSTYFG